MNYNEVFPSNYLKADDLGGGEPIVTIADWKMEKLGDDDKLVIYFKGKEKGVVLNKTNATNIAEMYGPETDDWVGKQIKLVTAWVDFQGRSTKAIRVRPPEETNGAAPPPATPAEELSDEIPF